MASLLSSRGLSKSYYSKGLFSDLSIVIQEKQRIGLLGPNGAGKSTLLKILAGIEPYDDGEIVKQKHLKIAYVEQDSNFSDANTETTIIDYAVGKAISLGLSDEKAFVEASTILSQGDFDNFDLKISGLSGGQKKRFSICLSRLGNPDLVLFDEPTNHLDLQGILWLESYISRANFSCICISHDRFFMRNTCQIFWELNKIFPGGLFIKEGSYQQFLDHKATFFREQQNQIDSIRSKLRKEEEWLSRMPKARTTKAKFRIEAAYALQNSLSEIRERMSIQQGNISFEQSGRKTKKLIEITSLIKSFGDKQVINNFDLEVINGDRLGILGNNGSGKSTLLKLIAENIKADAGKIKKAENLNIAYFEQSKSSLNPDWTLKRALCEESDHVTYRGRSIHVASWARRFKFSAPELENKISDLSGGEKARVYIARMMLLPADVLILDEPTNDLDIETLELLEESLLSFQGAIIVVSHDRYLMNKLCNSFFGLDGRGNASLFAAYDQWQNSLYKKKPKTQKPITSEPAPKNTTKKSKKLSYKYQREFDQMEDKIFKAEQDLEDLESEASKEENATNFSLQQELGDKISALSDEIASMYERWSELEKMQQ